MKEGLMAHSEPDLGAGLLGTLSGSLSKGQMFPGLVPHSSVNNFAAITENAV